MADVRMDTDPVSFSLGPRRYARGSPRCHSGSLEPCLLCQRCCGTCGFPGTWVSVDPGGREDGPVTLSGTSGPQPPPQPRSVAPLTTTKGKSHPGPRVPAAEPVTSRSPCSPERTAALQPGKIGVGFSKSSAPSLSPICRGPKSCSPSSTTHSACVCVTRDLQSVVLDGKPPPQTSLKNSPGG